MKHTLIIFVSLCMMAFSCTKDEVDNMPSGQVDHRTSYIVSGTITWEGLAVKDATVKLSGAATATTTTDASGNYSFTVSTLGSYTITPSKTINLLNGCDTADVNTIQRHVAVISAINDPYRRVAADINKNGTLNITDASTLNQALLGNPAAQNIMKPSWRFVDAAYTLVLPPNHNQAPTGFPQTITVVITGNTPNQNFIGIKTGDVNATANPQL